MNTATITHVFHGIEHTTCIEDTYDDMFLARVVGAIQGITMAGEHVTRVVTAREGVE